MLHLSNKKLNLLTIIAIIIFNTLILSACSNKRTLPYTEQLVNASIVTLETLKNRKDLQTFNTHLKKAAGVAIFPSIYKAGFFVGAEGGNGLLIAKDTSGNWGYPAFYTLASGSWGFQWGGQKSGVIFIIRSHRAIEALIKHQGKVSAEAGIAAGHVGTSLEGSITTNLGADMIAYSDSKGLFGGVSVEGSAFVRRNDLNSEYYGGVTDPFSILIQHAHQNAQAELLRNKLSEKIPDR